MTFSPGDDVRDAIIPLSGWPGAITSYDVAADPVAGIEVTVRFRAANGVPEAMLRVYAAVREQLADERVTLFATSSLWGGEHEQLAKERLRAFVDQAIAHLGGRGPQPRSVTFAIAVDDAGRAKQERSLFRLEVALVLERAAFTGEDGTPIPKAEAATWANPAVTAATVRDFAERLADAFGDGYRLAVAASAETTATQLWIARLGSGGIEIGFAPAGPKNDAHFFAPRPISTSLQSGTFPIRRYRDDWNGSDDDFETTPRPFSEVDADAWALEVGRSIGKLFTSPAGEAIAQADPEAYEAMIADKRVIASALGERTATILQDDDGGDLRAAAETVRRIALDDLAAPFTIGAIVQIPANVANASWAADEEPARLYGVVAETPRRPGESPPNEFSAASVSLENGRRYLTFALTAADPTGRNTVGTALSFVPTRLERGAAASRLELVPIEGADQPFAIGAVRVPIPLRRHPWPLTVAEQRVVSWPDVAPSTDGQAFDRYLRWRYRFTYALENVAQDTVHVRVDAGPRQNAGTPSSTVADGAALTASGLAAFARFLSEFAQIEPRLDLVRTASPSSADPVVRAVIARIRALVHGVAIAFHDDTTCTRGLAEEPRASHASYAITAYDAGAVLEVVRPSVDERDADSPDWPEIEGYARRSSSVEKASYARLTAEREEGFVERVLTFPPVSVLVRETAAVSLFDERNAAFGGPDERLRANREFIYRAPPVAAPAVMASIVVDETIAIDGAALDLALSAFFVDVFAIDPAKPPAATRSIAFGVDAALVVDAAGPDPAARFRISVPVLLATSYELDLAADWRTDGATFVEVTRAALERWNAAQTPPPGSSFIFDFTLFAATAETPAPLLRLRNVELPLRGDPAWWAASGQR